MVRIQSGEGLAQGRGVVLFVCILLGIALLLQPVVGADNQPALDLVCGFFALLFVWSYFKTRLANGRMYVPVPGIVPVDATALGGIAPAAPVGKKVAV